MLTRPRAMPRTGTHDLLHVRRPGAGAFLLPFARELVPVVDLELRRMLIDPPEGLLELEFGDEEPGRGGGAEAPRAPPRRRRRGKRHILHAHR